VQCSLRIHGRRSVPVTASRQVCREDSSWLLQGMINDKFGPFQRLPNFFEYSPLRPLPCGPVVNAPFRMKSAFKIMEGGHDLDLARSQFLKNLPQHPLSIAL
jgi:hypothetical protein